MADLDLAQELRLRAKILCALLIVGCGPETEPVTTDDRAYEVYTALIEQVVLVERWAGPPRSPEQRRPIDELVVLGESDPEGPQEVGRAQERLVGLDRSTIEDYDRKVGVGRFDGPLDGVGRYSWISMDTLQRSLERGWASFYEAHPGAPGLVTFTQVGFNARGDQALTYMMHLRSGTWGQGSFYLMRREDSGWVIADQSILWRS